MTESESWRMPDEPLPADLSEREREVARRVSRHLREWIDRSLSELQERVTERQTTAFQKLRSEIDAAIHEERDWERTLDTKLKALLTFEVEFGSSRTAEETRALFREVRQHLAQRDARWKRILEELARLSEDSAR